jgi:hypothetical protein
MNSIPGALALAFAVEDFGSFLWTLSAWRKEVRTAQAPGSRFSASDAADTAREV